MLETIQIWFISDHALGINYRKCEKRGWKKAPHENYLVILFILVFLFSGGIFIVRPFKVLHVTLKHFWYGQLYTYTTVMALVGYSELEDIRWRFQSRWSTLIPGSISSPREWTTTDGMGWERRDCNGGWIPSRVEQRRENGKMDLMMDWWSAWSMQLPFTWTLLPCMLANQLGIITRLWEPCHWIIILFLESLPHSLSMYLCLWCFLVKVIKDGENLKLLQGWIGLPNRPGKFSLTCSHYRALSQKNQLIDIIFMDGHRESPSVPPAQSEPELL